MIEFDSNKNEHISILLFGGLLDETQEVELDYVYKSGVKEGLNKKKKITITTRINGLSLIPHSDWITKKPGVYQTNEEVLNLIAKGKPKLDAVKIANLLLKIRELNKLLSTYYYSVESYIDENDLRIRPQFSHCGYEIYNSVGGGTKTARLSCTKPNLQNQPNGIVKEHFVSRWYSNGNLISADYSQIEVRVQAWLSNDLNFIKDIINGVDFHIKYLSFSTGKSYESLVYEIVDKKNETWIAARSKIKGFTFSRAFGAGVKRIAIASGLTEQEVKRIIEKDQIEYPRLHLWKAWLQETVNTEGFYKNPFNRIYKFKKYKAAPWKQEKGIMEDYSYNEIINHQVQGFTFDIVLMMIGQFWRKCAILNRDKYLMINTVHDSLMLDCKKEYEEDAKIDLGFLENVQEILLDQLDYRFNMPTPIDIKVGRNWSEI